MIQRQWDAVSHFRAQILSGARQHLRATTNVADADVAATLCAITLLDRLPLATALDELLRARDAACRAVLDEPGVEADGAAGVVDRLIRLSLMVDTTLRHVHGLFLPNGAAPPLLEAHLAALVAGHAVAAPQGAADGAAGPERTFVHSLFGSRHNLHALLRHLPASVQRYTPYLGSMSLHASPDAVVAAAGAWFDATVAVLRPGVLRHLAAVRHGSDLARVRLELARSTWARESAPATAGTDALVPRPSWQDTCTAVLGGPRSLWQVLLRPEVHARALVVLEDAAAAVPTEFGRAVQAFLASPPATVVAAADLAPFVWGLATAAPAPPAVAAPPLSPTSAGADSLDDHSRSSLAAVVTRRTRGLDPTLQGLLGIFGAALASSQVAVRTGACASVGPSWRPRASHACRHPVPHAARGGGWPTAPRGRTAGPRWDRRAGGGGRRCAPAGQVWERARLDVHHACGGRRRGKGASGLI